MISAGRFRSLTVIGKSAGRMEMQDQRYLLNLEQFLTGEHSESLIQEALGRIDKERRRKALLAKHLNGRVSALGAGLLLQKVMKDFEQERQEEAGKIQCYSVRKLMGLLGDGVIEPEYGYGQNGKPYLKDRPLKFNLSHSGAYVFCGVSRQEIGVDIQKIQKAGELRLAKRFFPRTEYRQLERCGDEEKRRQLFFRIWTRKEAYGKLTGQGVAEVLGKDLLNGSDAKEVSWEEYDIPQGYRICVCKMREAE